MTPLGRIVLLLAVVSVLGIAALVYASYYSPQARRTLALERVIKRFEKAVADGDRAGVLAFFEQYLVPDARITLAMSYQTLGMADGAPVYRVEHGKPDFIAFADHLLSRFQERSARIAVSPPQFGNDVNAPTFTLSGQLSAQGSGMLAESSIESRYAGSVQCDAQARITAQGRVLTPALTLLNCTLKVQILPVVSTENIERMKDVILKARQP